MNAKLSSRDAQEQPVALITGAGRRVGQGIARALAARGYRLALHAGGSIETARKMAAELTAAGTPAAAFEADLRDEAGTRAMVRAAAKHFGRIDALMNNAAIWSATPLEQVTGELVREYFEINALATFICGQEAGLQMVKQPTGGAIVNFGDWAIQRPYANYAAYFLAKGAIPTLTRSLAVELASRNPRIRVNAILPGPILLPEDMTVDERQRVIDATLVKRSGTLDDVASAVLFLLENSFVTGVCLPLDGGRSIYSPDEER